jgi:hypothetical protein
MPDNGCPDDCSRIVAKQVPPRHVVPGTEMDMTRTPGRRAGSAGVPVPGDDPLEPDRLGCLAVGPGIGLLSAQPTRARSPGGVATRPPSTNFPCGSKMASGDHSSPGSKPARGELPLAEARPPLLHLGVAEECVCPCRPTMTLWGERRDAWDHPCKCGLIGADVAPVARGERTRQLSGLP